MVMFTREIGKMMKDMAKEPMTGPQELIMKGIMKIAFDLAMGNIYCIFLA